MQSLLPPEELDYVNQGLRRLGLKNLREYYDSVYWMTKKQGYFSRHEYKCVQCPERKGLHLHHRTYRNLGRELDSDLEYRCEVHHDSLHRGWTSRELRRRRELKGQKRGLLKMLLFGV